MIFLLLWALGLVVGIITAASDPSIRTLQSIAYNLLFYQMVITIPLIGTICFIGHVFKSDHIAAKNGWPKGNLFQKELGMAQVGWAIAGISSIWFRGSWTAIILIFSPMFIGAALIHFIDMIRNRNAKPGNPVIIFADVLVPLSLIALSILARIW
ncbi:MAG TPA: DUF6790 family protein [Spirochaetota bacterium]